jgi:hypothetical protein
LLDARASAGAGQTTSTSPKFNFGHASPFISFKKLIMPDFGPNTGAMPGLNFRYASSFK